MTQHTAAPVHRRRRLPGQGMLLGAAALLIVGAFLPWLYTPMGQVSGIRGPGLWTFYAAMLAFTGGILPFPRLATIQGLVCGLVALALPVWQVVHVLSLVGTSGWYPGPGLVLTVGGGVLCLAGVRKVHAGTGGPSPVADER